MQKPLLFLFCLFTLITKAQRNPISEKNNNFGSKEILLLSVDSTDQSITNQRLFSFNWRGYNLGTPPYFLPKSPRVPITNAPTANNHVMIAEAADLNGDGLDEPIYLFEKSNAWQVVIGNIASSLDSATRSYSFTLSAPANQTGVSHGAITTNPNRFYPILVTGNFDTDANMEFAVAFKNPTSQTIKIQLFDTDGGLIPIARASVSTDSSFTLGFGDAYSLASADLDGDGKDELVLLGAERNNNNSSVSFPYSLYLKTYSVNSSAPSSMTAMNRQVLDNDLDNSGYDNNNPDYLHTSLTKVRVKDSTGVYTNDRLVACYYFAHNNYSNNTFYNQYLYLLKAGSGMTSLILLDRDSAAQSIPDNSENMMIAKTGDYNGMYPNEVAIMNQNTRIYSVRNDSLIYLTIQSGMNVSFNNSIDGFDMADIDADGKDELILFSVALNSSNGRQRFNLRIFGDNSQSESTTYDMQTGFSNNMCAVMVGNLDGSDFRLDNPIVSQCTYRMPLRIIGTVPTHYDIIDTTVYDPCNCWRLGQSASCPFNSRFSTTSGTTNTSNMNLKSDWSVTAGANAGVSFAGVDISASMESTYGQNFSRDISSTISFTVSITANTTNDDLIQCREVPMTVYEYPVKNSSGRTIDYLLAAFPSGSGSDAFYQSRSFYSYLPDHEVGNLMSYPNGDTYNDMSDFAVDSGSNRATILPLSASSIWNVSNSGSNTRTITTASSFGVTNSTGWNAGINAEVSASGFGMGMNVKGSYNMSGMNVASQTVNQSQDFVFNIGSYSGPSIYDYTLAPRIYWNQDGAVKINWKVQPDSSAGSFYDTYYGSKSDPAIILPWKYEVQLYGLSPSNPKVDRTQSMYFKPTNPSMFDTVTVFLKVFNYSFKPITDSTEVSFYRGDPASGGTIITGLNGQTIVKAPPLGSRGRAVVSMKFIATDTTFQRIYAVVDPRNVQSNEVHENNNKGWAYYGYDCNRSNVLIGIDELTASKENIQLKVFPNPSGNDLTLAFTPLRPELVTVELYDFYGRKTDVLFQNFLMPDEVVIHKDFPELPPGLYIVRIRSNEGMDISTRWIKM